MSRILFRAMVSSGLPQAWKSRRDAPYLQHFTQGFCFFSPSGNRQRDHRNPSVFGLQRLKIRVHKRVNLCQVKLSWFKSCEHMTLTRDWALSQRQVYPGLNLSPFICLHFNPSALNSSVIKCTAWPFVCSCFSAICTRFLPGGSPLCSCADSLRSS